jgi:hypothetical protein
MEFLQHLWLEQPLRPRSRQSPQLPGRPPPLQQQVPPPPLPPARAALLRRSLPPLLPPRQLSPPAAVLRLLPPQAQPLPAPVEWMTLLAWSVWLPSRPHLPQLSRSLREPALVPQPLLVLHPVLQFQCSFLHRRLVRLLARRPARRLAPTPLVSPPHLLEPRPPSRKRSAGAPLLWLLLAPPPPPLPVRELPRRPPPRLEQLLAWGSTPDPMVTSPGSLAQSLQLGL